MAFYRLDKDSERSFPDTFSIDGALRIVDRGDTGDLCFDETMTFETDHAMSISKIVENFNRVKRPLGYCFAFGQLYANGIVFVFDGKDRLTAMSGENSVEFDCDKTTKQIYSDRQACFESGN